VGQIDDISTLEIRAWFDRDTEWLHRALRRRLRLASAEADDLVQSTWLRVLRSTPAEIAHPRAFLAQIALNLFRDDRRRERLRRDKLHLVVVNDAPSHRPDDLQEQEVDRVLEQIIADLPERLRDVFVLSRFERMTNRDIGKHLGISVKTVELRIAKAMEQCLTKLQG
jgi:RNA polymerase sigma-70 factor (ECF subfamily)